MFEYLTDEQWAVMVDSVVERLQRVRQWWRKAEGANALLAALLLPLFVLFFVCFFSDFVGAEI